MALDLDYQPSSECIGLFTNAAPAGKSRATILDRVEKFLSQRFGFPATRAALFGFWRSRASAWFISHDSTLQLTAFPVIGQLIKLDSVLFIGHSKVHFRH